MSEISDLASRVAPFMSDMEAARAIQHRCECLEAACVRDSKLRPSYYYLPLPVLD